ncbi:MAG: PIG-L family deacetylase [Gemmatimonadota bacterium]|nr:MAG: PIG-L family deacetylase [Gemmatimonadota bacterium]
MRPERLPLRRRTHPVVLGVALCLVAAAAPLRAQEESLDVLLVTAHPDDEAMFGAAVYKITHTLKGNVDLALITDGSGGFRYAQLAESIYGLDLTDEETARQYLPAIRKRELMAGGAIIGLRNYFFMDEFDHAYTENVDTVLNHVWDAAAVRERLRQIMTRGNYDFVFVHLPVKNFHAHHVAASLLALEAASALPDSLRPVVLGCFIADSTDPDFFSLSDHSELPGYPITRVRSDVSPFIFDRTEALSEDGRLNYQIVVNWLIAEHRTQGTMQLLINRGDRERFWIFEANGPGSLSKTEDLFERLAAPVFTGDHGDQQ